jgi:hypothetical protein
MAKSGATSGVEQLRGDDLALYKELGKIGRRPYPLEPEGLADCDHLLRCPAIRHLALEGTTREQLAVIAAQVLRQIIEELVDEDYRKIAQTAFATIPSYQGMPVSKRQEVLYKDHNISQNIYSEHRPHVIRAIMFKLCLTPDAVIRPIQDSPAAWPSVLSEGLAWIAQKAATLYFAALATLFVSDFDSKLRAAKLHSLAFTIKGEPAPTAAYLFDAYLAFSYGEVSDMDADPEATTKSWRSHLASHLPAETVERLLTLRDEIQDCTPIGRNRITIGDHFPLLVYGHRGLVTRHVPPPTHFQPLTERTIRPDDPIAAIYDRRWLPWLTSALSDDQSYAPSDLERLVGASGKFSLILGFEAKISMPVQSRARTVAYKAVSTYYPFDEWVPILDGKSLRQYVETFFDTHGAMLVNNIAT